MANLALELDSSLAISGGVPKIVVPIKMDGEHNENSPIYCLMDGFRGGMFPTI